MAKIKKLDLKCAECQGELIFSFKTQRFYKIKEGKLTKTNPENEETVETILDIKCSENHEHDATLGWTEDQFNPLIEHLKKNELWNHKYALEIFSIGPESEAE